MLEIVSTNSQTRTYYRINDPLGLPKLFIKEEGVLYLINPVTGDISMGQKVASDLSLNFMRYIGPGFHARNMGSDLQPGHCRPTQTNIATGKKYGAN